MVSGDYDGEVVSVEGMQVELPEGSVILTSGQPSENYDRLRTVTMQDGTRLRYELPDPSSGIAASVVEAVSDFLTGWGWGDCN